MFLRVSYKKKYEKRNFFASLKSLKKGVRFGVGSGFVSQRYGCGSAPKHQGSPTLANKKCFAVQAACKESQKQYMPVKLDEVGIKL
jgi:hypothetical protein